MIKKYCYAEVNAFTLTVFLLEAKNGQSSVASFHHSHIRSAKSNGEGSSCVNKKNYRPRSRRTIYCTIHPNACSIATSVISNCFRPHSVDRPSHGCGQPRELTHGGRSRVQRLDRQPSDTKQHPTTPTTTTPP